jgi:hypothetical protein
MQITIHSSQGFHQEHSPAEHGGKMAPVLRKPMLTMNSKLARWLLWGEALGFIAIILLSWLDALVGFRGFLFGEQSLQSSWHESLLETCIVLVVAVPVLMFTDRMVRRLYYMDSYLKICAWCQKINHDNEWLTLDDFTVSGLKKDPTHGICPECAEPMRNPDRG